MIPLDLVAAIPATADVAPRDVSHWQNTVSWVILLVVIAGGVVLRAALRYRWLGDDEKRHLRSIRPAIAGLTWHNVVIRDDEPTDQRLQDGVDATANTTVDTGPGPVRAALGDLRGWVGRRVPQAPPLAVRGAVEGLVILLLGALVAVPLSRWEQALSPPDLSVSAGPTVGVDALRSGLSALATGIELTVPGGGVIVMLSLTAGILTVQTITNYWLPIGLLLIVGSLATVWLNAKTDDDLTVVLYPDRRGAALNAATWLLVVWATAATPTLLGEAVARYTGDPFYATLGAGAGAFVGVIVLAYALVGALIGFGRRLQYGPEWVERGAADLPVVRDGATGVALPVIGYRLVRKALTALAIVALPVLAYLAVQAVSTRAVARPVLAFLDQPGWVQAALLAGPAALLVVAIVRDRERAAELWLMIRRGIATRTIQSARFVQGIPIFALALGFLIGWAYVSLTIGVVLAAIFGVAVRVGILLYERGRVRAGTGLARTGPFLLGGLVFAIVAYGTGAIAGAGVIATIVVLVGLAARTAWRKYGLGLARREKPARPPSDQVVEIPDEPLRDANGDPIYVARVDGRPLARRDPDALLTDVYRVLEQRFETGETPTLLAHEYYEQVVKSGRVDEEAAFKSVRGDLATRVTATLREEGDVERERLRDELEEYYPEQVIVRTLKWLRERGDIGVRDGDYVLTK